jgi:sugar-specific transcriptional regulator TrmB
MQKIDLQLKNSLKELGFPEKEANVYLAILELGKGTVSQISRKADINRTTGYDILDSLVNKGLVSVSGKEPKQEFVAESPDKLKMFLEEQVARMKTHADRAEQLIPKLQSIHNIGDRPRVRFYEGLEGLKEVYEDTLTAHEPIRAYATFDDMHRTLPHYFPEYYRRRAEKGISIRGIIPDTEAARDRVQRNREETRQTALVPADKYYFSPEIDVYDDKIMIASWREKLGIIIESKEIADAMKKIYELAWAEAKRLDEMNFKIIEKPR